MKNFYCVALLIGCFVSLISCKPADQQSDSPAMAEPNDIQNTSQPNEETDTMIPTASNSRVSINWAGTYRGVLPCAYCEGIKTDLTLYQSETYRLVTLYLGKKNPTPAIREGKFEWDKTGGKIKLQGIAEGEAPRHFRVGEEKLFLLNEQGNVFAGELAKKYILTKIYSDTVLVD